jgi:uncharacterized coiled-coil protein SlyX
MIFPTIVLLVGLQDNSQQLAEQRAQINRLQQEVEKVTAELKETRSMLQSEMKATCSSESRLQSNNLRIADGATAVRFNLFSMVSNPSDGCLPAEIRITATYSDASEVFVCSGSVAIGQSASVQNTLFELRPYEPEVFLKWWDGPTLRQQSLVCRDYQGIEVRSPTDYASSLRIYVTSLPKRGGLSTSEFQLSLPRIQRQ